ncbi:MAG: hypothetical protein H7Z43_15935, partial [Clostridia bacterium]|nr:hypothetical protein [Deltaproteobacteria bacterium]
MAQPYLGVAADRFLQEFERGVWHHQQMMRLGYTIFYVPDVAADPEAAFARAIAAGAELVHAVVTKPWGQCVAHVRDLNGCIVEL